MASIFQLRKYCADVDRVASRTLGWSTRGGCGTDARDISACEWRNKKSFSQQARFRPAGVSEDGGCLLIVLRSVELPQCFGLSSRDQGAQAGCGREHQESPSNTLALRVRDAAGYLLGRCLAGPLCRFTQGKIAECRIVRMF